MSCDSGVSSGRDSVGANSSVSSENVPCQVRTEVLRVPSDVSSAESDCYERKSVYQLINLFENISKFQ